MNKNLLLLVFSLLVWNTVCFSQVMYSDDFESYTVGNGVANEEGTWWNTWSGTPGSAEDPTISDAYAYAGTQSVKVSGTNDGVIEFADLTTGRYRVEFYIMVPDGTLGYYNIMQNFNEENVDLAWGMQVFLEEGLMTIDGAGAAAATYEYTPGEWFKVQHFIDLNSDWVDMYINDELIHAYQWSKGTYDVGDGLNKLDAFNFYAWDNDGAGTPEYYMDNFLIEEVETPYPPTDFQYLIENTNDIVLSWNAPIEGSPESYAIARNGQVIETTDQLTYSDLNLYPGSYEYTLFTYYGTSSGYSAPLTQNVDILGGVETELVVIEAFTNTTYCDPTCGVISGATNMMVNEGLDVAVIEYHNDGDYYFDFYNARSIIYGGASFPITYFNGQNEFVGYNSTAQEQNDVYDSRYAIQKDKKSVYTIDSWVEPISSSPSYFYTLHVDVEEIFDYDQDNLKLFTVLTESNISHEWATLTEVDFVAREMFPNENGIALDFTIETSFSDEISVEVDPTLYDVDNCELIVFVQNTETGQIFQAKKHELSSFEGDDIDECLPNSLGSNPWGSPFMSASSEVSEGYAIATSFQTTGGIIETVNTWMMPLYNSGSGFVFCDSENPMLVNVYFIEREGDEMGDTLYSFTNLSADYIDSGLEYNSGPVQFMSIDLPYGVDMTSGFILIEGVSMSDPNCSFYWINNGETDNISYRLVDGEWNYSSYGYTYCFGGVAPDCTLPLDLSATTTLNTAELSWTSDGDTWNLEWGEYNFIMGEGNNISGITETLYSLGSLEEGTIYDFYVQNDCGANGTSEWVGPFTFTTECGVANSLNESFETYVPPACWTAYHGTSNYCDWEQTSEYAYSGEFSAIAGANNYLQEKWLITGKITIPDNSKLVFYTTDVLPEDNGSSLELKISIGSNPTSTYMYTDIFTIYENDINNTVFSLYEYDMSAYAGSSVYIAFVWNNGMNNVENWLLDDVSLVSLTGFEEDFRNEINIYPNPTTGIVNVESEKTDLIRNIEVTDIKGQKVSSSEVNNSVVELDLTKYSKGVYFVKVTTNEGVYNEKIIVE